MTRNDIGILAMELYFPSTFVEQHELEAFYGVSAGKFTAGLGQERMAFCYDNEDINSLALTVVYRLMEKYNIDYKAIGRLEVGTETLVDKSKSVKTTLMQLFAAKGNYEITGIDNINACYGGTAALLNSLAWMESNDWDGRLALVVAGDIAVYAKGPARPTGGAGIVAMLIGFDAPIVFDRGVSATYMDHVYDFYKPNMRTEYPLVDGRLSITCFLKSLDYCYINYMDRLSKRLDIQMTLRDIDYFIFHTPYCKLVQKSIARMMYLDESQSSSSFEDADQYDQKLYMEKSLHIFESKTQSSLLCAKNLGNSYCASLFAGILSLLENLDEEHLIGKRVVMFAYGSGSAASMHSFVIKRFPREIKETINLLYRLEHRIAVSPKDYEAVMELREKALDVKNYTPVTSVDILADEVFYLAKIDDKYRRHYAFKSNQ